MMEKYSHGNVDVTMSSILDPNDSSRKINVAWIKDPSDSNKRVPIGACQLPDLPEPSVMIEYFNFDRDLMIVVLC